MQKPKPKPKLKKGNVRRKQEVPPALSDPPVPPVPTIPVDKPPANPPDAPVNSGDIPAPASVGVRHHPLAGRLPLGPLHPSPPATPPATPPANTSANSPATPEPRDTRVRPNTSIADRLFTLRTNVTLAEINEQIRTPVSDDHATLAIGVTSNFLWLIKHEASKRRLKMNQLVIGLVLQALTEDPTPTPTSTPLDLVPDLPESAPETIPAVVPESMEGAA